MRFSRLTIALLMSVFTGMILGCGGAKKTPKPASAVAEESEPLDVSDSSEQFIKQDDQSTGDAVPTGDAAAAETQHVMSPDARSFYLGLSTETPQPDPEADAKEAAEERAAILEYEAKLSRKKAERKAALANDFYNHLFGPAKETKCCYAPVGRYCAEGERLRVAYYGAAQKSERSRIE